MLKCTRITSRNHSSSSANSKQCGKKQRGCLYIRHNDQVNRVVSYATGMHHYIISGGRRCVLRVLQVGVRMNLFHWFTQNWPQSVLCGNFPLLKSQSKICLHKCAGRVGAPQTITELRCCSFFLRTVAHCVFVVFLCTNSTNKHSLSLKAFGMIHTAVLVKINRSSFAQTKSGVANFPTSTWASIAYRGLNQDIMHVSNATVCS